MKETFLFRKNETTQQLWERTIIYCTWTFPASGLNVSSYTGKLLRNSLRETAKGQVIIWPLNISDFNPNRHPQTVSKQVLLTKAAFCDLQDPKELLPRPAASHHQRSTK